MQRVPYIDADGKMQIIYSDAPYTPTSTLQTTTGEELFDDKGVIVIVPDGVEPGSELRRYIDAVKTEMTYNYGPSLVQEKKSSQITCEPGFVNPLAGKTLVIIGDSYNNNAVGCTRVLSEGPSNYVIRRNPWGDSFGNHRYAIILKQTDMSRPEDALYKFGQNVKNKKGYQGGSGKALDLVAACIGLKDELDLGEISLNVACNVIPVVELLPDAVDSGRCLLNSDKTIADEFVCTIIHAASAYDVVGYLAGAVSAGGGALVAEVGDGGIATVKALLKLAVKQLPTSVIKAAEPVFKGAPDLLLTMGEFVAKQGGDAIEATKTFIRMAQHGKAALEKTLEIISKSAIKWSNDAYDGLASLLKTRGLNYYDATLKPLGDQFAEYYSKAVGKGAANPETIELAKFQEIDLAYKADGVADMLEQGGINQLEMVIKNTSSTGATKIGTRQVTGVTRIVKGRATDVPSDFGWLHIKRKHMDGIWNGVGPNPPTTFLKEYGVKEESVVKNLIDEAIQKGTRNVDEETVANYVIDYVPYPGKKTMRVIVNKEFGTVTSAYSLEVFT